MDNKHESSAKSSGNPPEPYKEAPSKDHIMHMIKFIIGIVIFCFAIWFFESK